MEQTLLLQLSSPGMAGDTTSRLRQGYWANQRLYQAQTPETRQYLELQARALAEAMAQGLIQIRFSLPHDLFLESGNDSSNESVPTELRQQVVGGWLAKLFHESLLSAICQRLSELEGSSNRAVSVSGHLLRYSIAVHLTYDMLPVGKPVTYASEENDDIPNLPIDGEADKAIVIKTSPRIAGNESLVEERHVGRDNQYANGANHFYVPQWVAFDTLSNLIASSVFEAESDFKAMRHYLSILQEAIEIAPYMIADETWQQKRYGMLGQLVNQGRALAKFRTQEIIQKIRCRYAEHRLDRGLGLSLPYFDDQKLMLDNYEFTVIPNGRTMFVPAFVVLAAREQQLKVAGEIHLNLTTRRHLLSLLSQLEQAFLR